jgi:hypothetical protein
MASRASALNNLLRQISGSFGVALVTFVMMNRQAYHLVWLKDTLTWTSYAAIHTLNVIESFTVHQGLSPALSLSSAKTVLGSLLAQQSTIAGIDDAMLMAALLAFLIAPLGLFMNRKLVDQESKRQSKRFTPPAYLLQQSSKWHLN